MKVLFWIGAVWALPMNLIGVVLWLAAGMPLMRYSRGFACIYECKPWWKPKKFLGIAVGGFVFVQEYPTQQLLNHEIEHARQQAILGPFFLVLYPLASLMSGILYRSWYRANWFEIMARKVSGEE